MILYFFIMTSHGRMEYQSDQTDAKRLCFWSGRTTHGVASLLGGVYFQPMCIHMQVDAKSLTVNHYWLTRRVGQCLLEKD